jgi:hypothetical protein
MLVLHGWLQVLVVGAAGGFLGEALGMYGTAKN